MLNTRPTGRQSLAISNTMLTHRVDQKTEPMLPDINHQYHQITMLDASYQAATSRCQALHTIVDKKIGVTRA